MMLDAEKQNHRKAKQEMKETEELNKTIVKQLNEKMVYLKEEQQAKRAA